MYCIIITYNICTLHVSIGTQTIYKGSKVAAGVISKYIANTYVANDGSQHLEIEEFLFK